MLFICFSVSIGQIDPAAGWNILATAAVSPSLSWLQSLLEKNQSFDIVIGYSGWGPGQLDQEIQRGTWLYSDDINIKTILSAPITDRYQLALASLGLTETSVWMMQPIEE